MQFLILGILLDGPLALYDLHKRFTGGISLFYAASFGSIQRALRQIEAQGWAAPNDAPDTRRRKKLYAVTEDGRQAWREWMLSPVSGSDAEPQILARIYLLSSLAPHDRAACLAVIRERLTADSDALAGLAEEVDRAEIPEGFSEAFRYRRATLDYGIRSHALALTWLDELEGGA